MPLSRLNDGFEIELGNLRRLLLGTHFDSFLLPTLWLLESNCGALRNTGNASEQCHAAKQD